MRIVIRSIHQYGLMCLVLAGLVTCVESEPGVSARSDPATQPAPAATPAALSAEAEPTSSAALRDRAQQLWEARRDDKWDVVFDLIDPAERGDKSAADFVEWNTNNQLFIVNSFQIDDVATDDAMGWVSVSHNVRLRNIPESTRDVHRWEKWHLVDGVWRPAPPLAAENFPSPPVMRDAAAEDDLRQRFAACWEARYAKNYETLFTFYDPVERASIPLDEFAQTLDKIEFLAADVLFVEVIQGVGKVRVHYTHRPNDPNMRHIAPTDVVISEIWKNVDGEWYLIMPPKRKNQE